MNNEKEISFGAFDSELMRQEIFIPKGFEATIEGDKIILTRKDSEDERIRKFLIKWIQDNYYNGTTEIPTKTLIAWLEKQGSQNNTEDEDLLYRFCFYSYKDESNILYLSGLYVNGECRNKGIGTKILEVADEVAKNLNCYAIRLKTEIGSNAERLYRRNGYNTFKREGNNVWLEKQGEQKPFDYENADIQQKDFAPKETVKEAESNLTPLERKVKDILFSFHINAADGISFDGTMAIVHNLITLCQQEQKPADKIKPKFKVGDKVIGIVSDMQYYITDVCYDHYYTESGCIIMFCSQDNFKLVEQKPAWSREDEKIRQTIINEFKQCSEWYCSNGLTKEDCINWLNKQEYFEWGDEDNENMNSLCVLLDQMVSINAIGNEHSIEYKNWLKSIKQRMGG